MIVTKMHLKVLRYMYRHGSVTKVVLENLFDRSLISSLEVGGYILFPREQSTDFSIAPVTAVSDDALCSLTNLGIAEVERHQWFDTEYIVSHIVIPIALGIGSALLTLFLSA